MSDEEVTIPDEPEVTPEGVEETDTHEEEESGVAEVEETDGNEETDPEEESGEEESGEEPEEIEIKVGGSVLKVAKGSLPDDKIAQIQDFVNSAESSFTKKFQDVAERSKALSEAEKAIGGLQKMQSETMEVFSRGLKVKEDIGELQQELAELGRINLQAMWQSEPDKARQYSDYIAGVQAKIQQKNSELDSITHDVNQREQQFTQAEQQELTRRVEAGREYVTRNVKGFDEAKVVAYAISQGVPEHEAKMWGLNPVGATAFHKAMLYDAMTAESAKAKQSGSKKTPLAKPPSKLKGNASAKAAKKPKDMSPEEFSAWRYKQIEAKRNSGR